MIHSDFEYGSARFVWQAQYRDRDANVIVKVPGASANRTAAGFEERRDNVLGAGLAGAAGDTHDGPAPVPARFGREGLQSAEGVVYADKSPLFSEITIDESGGGSAAEDVRHEGVTVMR